MEIKIIKAKNISVNLTSVAKIAKIQEIAEVEEFFSFETYKVIKESKEKSIGVLGIFMEIEEEHLELFLIQASEGIQRGGGG